eukprot:31566-Pelagococcus_subviridis.AAC.2
MAAKSLESSSAPSQSSLACDASVDVPSSPPFDGAVPQNIGCVSLSALRATSTTSFSSSIRTNENDPDERSVTLALRKTFFQAASDHELAFARGERGGRLVARVAVLVLEALRVQGEDERRALVRRRRRRRRRDDRSVHLRDEVRALRATEAVGEKMSVR